MLRAAYLLVEADGRLKRPAARHVADGVAAAAEQQEGLVEALHVLHAAALSLSLTHTHTRTRTCTHTHTHTLAGGAC
jgi:hypothetical protein